MAAKKKTAKKTPPAAPPAAPAEAETHTSPNHPNCTKAVHGDECACIECAKARLA